MFSKVKLWLLIYVLDCQKVKYIHISDNMNLWYFMQAELLSTREQLLQEFSPDDACELGSQLTLNMPKTVCQVDF